MPPTDPNITETISKKPDIPKEVQVGDFIVGRYVKSEWSRFFPWENWDHAALVTRVTPLTIIESSGIILQRKDAKLGKEEVREGNLWLKNDLQAMLWLRPVFPDPLREMDHWNVPWKKRHVITEIEARKCAVAYARSQVGEPHNIWISKRNTKEWYCSYLVYKSYSRTVTNMYLESPANAINPLPWNHVTPEDLVQSNRSLVYHKWHHSDSA